MTFKNVGGEEIIDDNIQRIFIILSGVYVTDRRLQMKVTYVHALPARLAPDFAMQYVCEQSWRSRAHHCDTSGPCGMML